MHGGWRFYLLATTLPAAAGLVIDQRGTRLLLENSIPVRSLALSYIWEVGTNGERGRLSFETLGRIEVLSHCVADDMR